jgi:hypothetical protein
LGFFFIFIFLPSFFSYAYLAGPLAQHLDGWAFPFLLSFFFLLFFFFSSSWAAHWSKLPGMAFLPLPFFFPFLHLLFSSR